MKMKALLRSIYELLFIELAVAEDGTVVRQTVVRPTRGPAGLACGPGSYGAPAFFVQQTFNIASLHRVAAGA